MIKKAILPLFLALTLGAVAEEPDHAIHEELRALLKTTRESINSGKYEEMQPALCKDVRLTTIIQRFVGSSKDVPPYFQEFFGPGKILKSMSMDWQPDVLTELSPDKTWGICYGNGTEDYTLNDGRTYHMPTRWTSVVVKEADGKWRIKSMHIGTNFMDNPLLAEVAGKAQTYALMAAAGGLVAGLGVGFLLGRRKG